MRVDYERALKAHQKKLSRTMQNQLKSATSKAARTATKKTRTRIRDAARDDLPKGGGLNKWAARMPTISVRLYGRQTGVRIRLSRKGADMKGLNRGIARHPVFGNRKVWRNTRVAVRWFDRAVQRDKKRLMKELTTAISTAAKTAWRKKP